MKHLKAKEILGIVVALLLMAALTAAYGNIGLQTDIQYAKTQCNQKIDDLATSVTGLMESHALVNYNYSDILCTNTYLSTLPLAETVLTKGDEAIGRYERGVVVRVDGDSMIMPQDADLPKLEASDFTDAEGNLLEWSSFERAAEGSGDEATPPQVESGDARTVCTFYRIYAGYYYVEFSSANDMADFLDTRMNFQETMASLEKIYGGYIVTFDADDENHPLTHRSSNLDGAFSSIRDLGIDPDAPDKGVKLINIDGRSFVYALSRPIASQEYEPSNRMRIAFMSPVDRLANRRIPRLVMALGVSLLFFLTAVCWVICSMRVFRRSTITAHQRKQYGPERIRRTVIAIGMAGVLSVGLVTFFINCLMQLYTATQNNMNLLNRINAVATQTQGNTQRAQNQQREIYVNYARRIADLLAKYPELQTREALQEICGFVGADYLMLYDDSGRETLSNAPYVNLAFGYNTESPSYDFRKLLMGVPSIAHDAALDEQTGLERQLVGVRMDDGDTSDGYGALIMAMVPDSRYDNVMSVDRLIQAMTPADGLCLALNPETGDIMHASDPDLIGQSATGLGMKAQNLQGGLMDHFTLNGQRWYSCSDNYEDLVYHSAVRADAIYRRLPITALLFGSCFLVAYVLLAVVLLAGYTDRSIDDNSLEIVDNEDDLTQKAKAPREDDRLGVALAQLRITHVGQTPEQKTRSVFTFTAGIMLACALAAMHISAIGRDRFFIFYYVLNGQWTPGVNLFAVARIIIMGLTTTVALLALQLLTNVGCALLQRRGETILRLISSVIQYAAVLAMCFSAFDSLGFDSRALLASVGVLSLTVSLGAKDLVADVLSGVTIAFSDEYQIGDFIEINGFRGWVQDIGVRATTLVNNDGNIKHFSNRDVKNILNLSRRNCQYTINVTIANDQPLRKVEEILAQELPRIGQATPEIIKGPEYKGVTGFTPAGVTIAISAECKEHHYGKVRSRVNREIRLLLEENGIVLR